ncbi:hypothetical protein D3C80_2216720 [compost metagenome]
MGQGTRPGTKIIQRDPHPQVTQQAQLFVRLIEVLHQGLLGDFHFQLPRLQLVTRQHLT